MQTTGDNSEEDPPVPIPNTVVKLFSADDTWRETARESRSLPVFSMLSMVITSFVMTCNDCEAYNLIDIPQ